MKLVIASDIHGSAYWTERLVAAIHTEAPTHIVLLGDLLYHGPRNDLSKDYAPKRVIPLLRELANDYQVVAVRGNCDAEVDQMVLSFPLMSDFAELVDSGGRSLFFTHGHVFGAGYHNSVDCLPQLRAGTAVVFGHTHHKVNEAMVRYPELWAFNPGSVSIPKDGTHSFGVYQDGQFSHRILGETEVEEYAGM
ncbi:phosphodiesterase [Collinsella sp. zg1085]|uniref:phosphodiesterase n=1 Tax=Collinsella sp. zg1085 TaxID=2844380 RepID=UPI001C0B295B|nr:phosphodiesterase [Collinsella sp. zg1085]QWT17761.1 phosphodiesterase [Collinsella sp. zg1085]